MNGLILVDKPEGCTSHDVVSKLRKALKMRQVGHAGTLDPLASGLLVALIGQGTKLSDYLLNGDKKPSGSKTDAMVESMPRLVAGCSFVLDLNRNLSCVRHHWTPSAPSTGIAEVECRSMSFSVSACSDSGTEHSTSLS